ncbi:hypothetical protein INT45_002840 [Circinella minor]|uniref:C2H2-type domain-containing protein n=1 Tax=Circinella minor TaxID=1195481 RepID=A0A8H7S157_9FUNG|nr:hypothetical protein INT45_002840 [Circinella minor]
MATDYYTQLLSLPWEQDNGLLEYSRQGHQNSVTENYSMIPTFYSNNYSIQDSMILENPINIVPLQQSFQYDLQQEHFLAYYQHSDLPIEINHSDYQVQVGNLPLEPLPEIDQQDDNSICYYPSPAVTPLEASNPSNTITGITPNDAQSMIYIDSEESRSNEKSSSQSESLSSNNNDKGLVGHYEKNNGGARERYYCPLCPANHKDFSRSRDSEKRHMESVHDNIHYFCDMCGSSYSKPDSLKRHKNNKHRKQ